ncbi:MAG: hypothetical protein AAGL17_22035 [Cyanobacteria bacterium J06576_12]
MDYQVEKWQRQDWRKGSRHYCCELKQDLFGRWVLLRRWGRVSDFMDRVWKNCVIATRTVSQHLRPSLGGEQSVVTIAGDVGDASGASNTLGLAS